MLIVLWFKNQKVKFASVFHVARRDFGVFSAPPKQIGAAGPLNRPAGVLVQDKSIHIDPCVNVSRAVDYRFSALRKRQPCPGKKPSVQGDGSTRAQFDTQKAEGTIIFDLKEYIAGIVM